MSAIPVEDHSRKHRAKRAKKTVRPPPCTACKHPDCWWNGTRTVRIESKDDSGAKARMEKIRERAKCISCRVSFALYTEGEYPNRQYQLDVVADVVATYSFATKSIETTATEHTVSGTSIRRWTSWVSGLIDPVALNAFTLKMDPASPVGRGITIFEKAGDKRAKAALVLRSLEDLGVVLGRRKVLLHSKSGLGRVLEWQHRSHGVVVNLGRDPCTLSPPKAVGEGLLSM